MARYSQEHKSRSRAALISAAAGLFRRHGYRGVSIDDICAEAELTRGAFYRHFRSKAELYEQVLAGNHDLVRRLAERRNRTTAGLARAATRIARDYLDPGHAPGVLGGCSLAALAMDTIRADPAAQAAYADAVERSADEFARGIPGADEERALAALALCVGGLLVANACGDEPVGGRLALAASRVVGELLQAEPA